MPPDSAPTCKLKTRGTHQLELKLHYPLAPRSRQIFETDVYVFAPDKLHLTSESYGVSRVLQELVLLVRQSEPRIPLEELMSPGTVASPLARLEAMRAAGGTRYPVEEAIHELKTLVNAYRAESGTAVAEALRAATQPTPDLEAMRKQIGLLVRLPEAYRRLRTDLQDPVCPAALRQALVWADEGLSVVLERSLFRVLDRIRGRRTYREGPAMVRGELAREYAYRASTRMGLTPATGASRASRERNERVLMRQRALKRWSQSALYLGRQAHRGAGRIGEVIGDVAAAMAMTLSVVAGAFADRHFSSYSLPWAFTIVIAYILRERIKMVARSVVGAVIPRWLSDRSHHLVDATVGRAGLVREAVTFRWPGGLPPEVRAARESAPSSEEALPGDLATRESVVHLRVWMRTRSSRLLEAHGRLGRLTGIVRWVVDGWLEEMDAPYAGLRVTVNGGERRVMARHVYPIHLVVRVRERRGGPVTLWTYRMAVSREGIVRAEPIRAESAAASPDVG